ncbi:hypothetical protein [Maribacter aestuarii]|uniref:hypothetical protein n=1 Tax=Maribacter aestuarii TaxID=1130723 RepID=UPI00248B6480|nr:hypothetical protein [Maribacter aestuarii]
MSRTLTIILILSALGLIVYNVTLIDFENLLEGNSIIALIGIMASFCAIVLLLIFNASKKVQKKIED